MMEPLPNEDMVSVHIIRQDHARALAAYEADPTPENRTALEDVRERRARAMRSLARDDGATVRQVSAMFRCSKTATRAALGQEAA